MKDYDKIGDEQIVDYILGKLTPEDELEIDMALAEDDLFDRFHSIEEDLFDEYARGGLTPEVRQLVERKLLSSPEIREQVELSQNLYRIAAQVRADQQILDSVVTLTEPGSQIQNQAGLDLDDHQLVDYLLGRSHPGDEQRIDMALADDQFFDRLMWVEEDLIDDYVAGRVSTADRPLIQKRLLDTAPRRLQARESQELFQVAREMRQAARVKDTAPGWRERLVEFFSFRSPLLAYGMLLAFTLLGAGTAYLAWQDNEQSLMLAELKEREVRLGEERDELLADSAKSKREIEVLGEEVSRLKSAKSAPELFATAVGRVPATRGGGERTGEKMTLTVARPILLTIPPLTRLADIEILIPGTSQSFYKATLQAESEQPILTMTGIEGIDSRGSTLIRITFPQNILKRSFYQLDISDQEERVTRRFTLQVVRP